MKSYRKLQNSAITSPFWIYENHLLRPQRVRPLVAVCEVNLVSFAALGRSGKPSEECDEFLDPERIVGLPEEWQCLPKLATKVQLGKEAESPQASEAVPF